MPTSLTPILDQGNRPYSDSNPPETLMMTEYSGAVSTPPSGQIVLYSPDGTGLLWKDDTGTVRTLGGGTKGSALPAAVGLSDTDVLFGTDGTVTEKYSLNQLTTYFEQRARQHNASTATQTTVANTDTYMTGSDVSIPAGRLQAKTKYKCELAITKAAVGTGTPILNVRFGTAGTTADTSRLSFTWPAANTAVADEMKLTFYVTFRSVGSGTSAVLEGMLAAEHELTTTGFGGTGLGANIIMNTTGAGFDSTVASSKIGVSLNASTGGVWVIRQCWAMLENLA